MSRVLWLGLLIAVVVIVAVPALAGLKAKGTRPIAGTGLMSAARIVLVVLVALVAYLAWLR